MKTNEQYSNKWRKEQPIREQILLAHLNVIEPDKVIDYINKFYPRLSGLCYYDKEIGGLASKDKRYEFYFDPYHRVIEVTELKPRKRCGYYI